MISVHDLIWLPYSPDLTLAGVTYACRSLAYTYDRMGGSVYDRLQRIVAGKAVELAVRRLLWEREVPHDLLGQTDFREPDRYDLALGGRRCDIKSFLVYQKDRIRNLHRQPDLLLGAAALVPSDQADSEAWSDEDLYLFAFLNALLTHTPQELHRARQRGQPVYWIHLMPETWVYSSHKLGLGNLVVTSRCRDALDLEVGGQALDQSFQLEQVRLEPQGTICIEKEFSSLAYLHLQQPADGSLTVHSSATKASHQALPDQWGNIWVYGMEVILLGYITRGDFRRKAHLLAPGSRVFQYPLTRTLNYSLPADQLHPMEDLFRRARLWKR